MPSVHNPTDWSFLCVEAVYFSIEERVHWKSGGNAGAAVPLRFDTKVVVLIQLLYQIERNSTPQNVNIWLVQRCKLTVEVRSLCF